jgi:acyl-coenzyme A synthetase/AMP-(fatty) acid ligase
LVIFNSASLISLNKVLESTIDSAFCISNQSSISRATFLAHAMSLSHKLPDQYYAINLCKDRYLFSVAFLAVFIREQVSLLPPNQANRTIFTIKENYPDNYVLSDNKNSADFYISFEMLESGVDKFPLINIDSPLSISFTSGSTGAPKETLKTWREFHASALLAIKELRLIHQNIVLVSTTPMQHMYGLETMFFWVLFSNMILHNSHPFYPEDIKNSLQQISGEKILISTPKHLNSCIQNECDWTDLKFILSSTAPMDKVLAESIEKITKSKVFEIFGSTETLSFASRQPTKNRNWKPYKGISLSRINDQIALQGGHIKRSVILDDEFNIDDDGNFTLLGRNTDLIKIAGKRASLCDLNNHLIGISGIDDGVFFTGINERMNILIVSRLSKEVIIEHLRHCMDAVFLPRRIYYVNSLPRNCLGKIIKADLEQLILDQNKC